MRNACRVSSKTPELVLAGSRQRRVPISGNRVVFAAGLPENLWLFVRPEYIKGPSDNANPTNPKHSPRRHLFTPARGPVSASTAWRAGPALVIVDDRSLSARGGIGRTPAA